MPKLTKITHAALLSLGLITTPFLANADSWQTDTVLASQHSLKMADAITAAKRHVVGDVLSVTFDDDNGGSYDVSIIADKTEHELSFSAVTGQLIKHEQERVQRSLAREHRAFKAAKLDLETAQTAAVRAVGGGEVVGFEFDLEKRTPVYEVDVLHNAQLKKVRIHANTGAVLSQRLDD
ncbi:MAG: PepSY domain-containing protein [Moraxella sp.]|nr:PepSY domain-containing protein [Moraxella sp.]